MRIVINETVGIALFLVVMCWYQGCKDKGVEPRKDCPVPTDTTSHGFTWQIDTLGQTGASVLYDVAIVSETEAWAVGEMYLPDSTGDIDSDAYNVAKWNGFSWTLHRVPVRDFGGATGSYPIQAIHAFGPNDVWLASAADLIQWDGTSYSGKAFFMTSIPFDGQVLNMWGTSSTDIYCVGRKGSIYHFTGSSWRKLSSGTTISIQDIWGGVNCNGETEVLALASTLFDPPTTQKKLLRIQGVTVTPVTDAGLLDILSSVWFVPGQRYYIGGDGVFKSDGIGNGWQQESYPPYYAFSVRGTAANDIVVAGGFGFLSHFNGSSWRHYTQTGELPSFNGNFYSVAISQKFVVAVGGVQSGAPIVVVGKR